MTLFRDLLSIVKRWYSSDRIRLSPTCGSFLRLQVGDVLLIREMLFEIIERNNAISGESSKVVFRMRVQHCPKESNATLSVELRGVELDFVAAELDIDGRLIELFEEDPVILSPSSSIEYA